MLIAPIAHLLDRQKRLCLVPDGSLNELPFAALISRQSGKYLIDEYALTLAPSASVFVLRSESQSARRGAERLLIAAVHSFDRERFPGLEDLSLAEREAKMIARLYPSSTLLLNEQAGKQRILREMPAAQVIHLATHGQADLAQPLRSKLIFPSAESGSMLATENDFLQAFEIYSLRLPQTRIVALSACETGFGQNRRGEGMMSLARPFLAAGVPTVIASLWKAESGATSELMIRFHQQLTSAPLTADESLRRA